VRTLHELASVLDQEVAQVLFTFPEDARWNEALSAIEFGVRVGEYDGVVRVGRLVFRSLLDQRPIAQRCLEAYYLHRTRLELIAERKIRRRQLTDDGNVEITGRDLRDREPRRPALSLGYQPVHL
jgi:Protein of unknown function (DUF1488)